MALRDDRSKIRIIIVVWKHFRRCTFGFFNKVVDVNFRGVWLCMQAQTTSMLPQKSGAIINLTAVSGHVGAPQFGMYAATEYANQGIRINAVSPGALNGRDFSDYPR